MPSPGRSHSGSETNGVPLQDTYEYHFFISYARQDANWAQWIAWQLEDAGYRVLLMAWDFPGGSNFVHEMHRGAVQAERTLAILSPGYLRSPFTHAEWKAAFALDPLGNGRVLIPVLIEPCDMRELGLLRALEPIDMVGLTQPEARKRLLTEIERARAPSGPQRLRPAAEPGFPGLAAGLERAPAFPGPARLGARRPVEAALQTWLLDRYGVPPHRCTAAARLADLGLPAPDVTELVLDLETEFGVDLPADLVTDAELATVGDVIHLFQ